MLMLMLMLMIDQTLDIEIINFLKFYRQKIIKLIVSMKYTRLAVLLMALVVFVSVQTIQQQGLGNKLFALENYQISNYTGSGISVDAIQNYTNLINNAYSLYGSDINRSTDYISKQLESKYGYFYSVVILQSNQTIGSFLLYCVGGDTVVSWTKVNTYQPNWIYIIWPITKGNSNTTTSYISSLGKGIGIDSQKENDIRSVVSDQEQMISQCGCYDTDMSRITKKLQQLDRQRWSIICKKYSALNYNSLLKSKNNQYIQLAVNTNKCQYVLLAI